MLSVVGAEIGLPLLRLRRQRGNPALRSGNDRGPQTGRSHHGVAATVRTGWCRSEPPAPAAPVAWLGIDRRSARRVHRARRVRRRLTPGIRIRLRRRSLPVVFGSIEFLGAADLRDASSARWSRSNKLPTGPDGRPPCGESPMRAGVVLTAAAGRLGKGGGRQQYRRSY